jgi:acetyl esterase/lipase
MTKPIPKTLVLLLLFLFPVCGIVQAQEVVPLWPDGVPNSQQSDEVETRTMGDDGVLRIEYVQVPDITVYAPPAEKNSGRAVIICPGGGYAIQAVNIEGTAVAEWLNGIGVTGIVLKYRLPHSKSVVIRHEAPMQDAQRAVRLVRHRAASWNIAPDKIGIMGFSAGGHLASTAATHFDAGDAAATDPVERESSRPDFAILVYPVVTFQGDFAHLGSRKNLLGENPEPHLIDYFSNEKQVTAETPPSFLVHGNDDKGVPVENSIEFYRALRRHGVDAELHVYKHGRHGFGVGRWGGPVASWTKRCEDWLETLSYLRLANVFGDNMVLQRDMPVPVWGWGEPGDKVTVKFADKTYDTAVDNNGRWEVRLAAMPAGGPFDMTVDGRNAINLRNILAGDVWVCGGQSNMAWTVRRSNNPGEEIAAANYDKIRILTVQRDMGTSEKQDIKSTRWQSAAGENIADFSAVGYFFGRTLHSGNMSAIPGQFSRFRKISKRI